MEDARVETIGVISDTHGLLRPEALTALQGVLLILHAGDVGDPDILLELELIAPVIAVRGNVDHGAWAERLPLSREVQVQEAHIHLRHIYEELVPKPGDVEVVITGHSHRPKISHENGTLYLNPGSAGPKRFSLPVTVARLQVRGRQCEAELMELPV